MMPIQHPGQFLLASLALVMIPGPAMLLMLSRRHMPEALASLAGIVLGDLIHIGASALGLGVLLSQWPQLMRALQLLGALYLLHMAWQLCRDSLVRASAGTVPVTHRMASAEAASWAPAWRQGLLLTLGNPKPMLFFAAFFPGFIRQPGHWFSGYACLALLFEALNLSFFGLLLWLRRHAGPRVAKAPVLQMRLRQFAALALGLCAVRLALGG